MIIPNGIFEERLNTMVTDGRWESNFWFITMQGCCDTDDERIVQSWFDRWIAAGKPENFDIQDAHEPGCQFFNKPYWKQPTWLGLIKVLLSYYGIKYSIDKYYDFQATHWARTRGTNYSLCSFGLMPIGKTEIGKFKDYSDTWLQWTGLNYMRNSETYEKRWLDERINKFIDKINSHKPKVVLFYTKTHTDVWNSIAGCNFRNIEGTENSIVGCPKGFSAEFYNHNGTLFVNMASPVAFGVCNDYFEQIGKKIFEYIGHRNLGKL